MRRFLLAAVFLLGVLVAAGVRPTFAGSVQPACCVCQCAGAAVQCLDAANPDACAPFLNGCGAGMNDTCRTGIAGGNCTAVAECTIAPAPAPALGATGLTLGVTLLSALALWRLRSRS